MRFDLRWIGENFWFLFMPVLMSIILVYVFVCSLIFGPSDAAKKQMEWQRALEAESAGVPSDSQPR